MAIDTSADLVAVVGELGLLDAGRQRSLADLGARHRDLRDLLLDLRSRNWLTSFQVAQVIQGRGRKLLLGPHVLIDRVGTGGMGEVFKAVHRRLDRVVALKVIRADELANPASLPRFHREAKSAAKLQHPNIVTVYDYADEGGVFYLSMEYLDGVDLSRLLHTEGPLPITTACDFARQAALGLDHAHDRGIVHRDVKPSNLFACSPPRPKLAADTGRPQAGGYARAAIKLLDLGLARFDAPNGDNRGDLTRQGVVVGTMDYVAPEQARDPRAVDRRCDIYSLGGTLYHLLAGSPPFPGGTPIDKVLRHQSDEPTPLTAKRADVTAELAAVVRKMMAKRPEDRYATAAEVAEALAPFAVHPLGSGSVRVPATNNRPSGPRPTIRDGVVPPPTRIVALDEVPPTPAGQGTRPVVIDPDSPLDGVSLAAADPSTASNPDAPVVARRPARPPRPTPWSAVAAVLVLLALALSAMWWLPAPTPSPARGFPRGELLAGVVPADAAGAFGFRPDRLFAEPVLKLLPGLDTLAASALPETPGLDPRSAATVRAFVLKGPTAKVVSVSMPPDGADFDWPSLAPTGPKASSRELPGGAGWYAARPPYVLAAKDRAAVDLLAGVADGRPPGSADDAVRELAQRADAGRDGWFYLVPSMTGPPPAVHKDFDPILSAILAKAVAAEGGIVVTGEPPSRLVVTVRLTAADENAAEELLKAVEAAKDFATDVNMNAVKTPATDRLRPAFNLAAHGKVSRDGRTVTAEAVYPAPAAERSGTTTK